MKILSNSLAATCLLIALSTAVSARECETGSTGVLEVNSFETQVKDLAGQEFIEFFVGIKNASDSDIRMVDGKFYIDDVLGRSIFDFSVKEDYSAVIGGVDIQYFILPASHGIERVLVADTSDLIKTVCVIALVTQEGEVVRFGE